MVKVRTHSFIWRPPQLSTGSPAVCRRYEIRIHLNEPSSLSSYLQAVFFPALEVTDSRLCSVCVCKVAKSRLATLPGKDRVQIMAGDYLWHASSLRSITLAGPLKHLHDGPHWFLVRRLNTDALQDKRRKTSQAERPLMCFSWRI